MDSPVQYGQYTIAQNNNGDKGPVLFSSGTPATLYEILPFIVTKNNVEQYFFNFAVNTSEAFVADFVSGDTGQLLLVEEAIDAITKQLAAENPLQQQKYYYELSLHGFIPVVSPQWANFDQPESE